MQPVYYCGCNQCAYRVKTGIFSITTELKLCKYIKIKVTPKASGDTPRAASLLFASDNHCLLNQIHSPSEAGTSFHRARVPIYIRILLLYPKPPTLDQTPAVCSTERIETQLFSRLNLPIAKILLPYQRHRRRSPSQAISHLSC